MRKANQEIKDPSLLEEILKGAEICRVAMTDGETPYMLPFNYGYKDGCIYIHSAPAGKKIDLLKIIPKEKACKWSTLYRSVVGYGDVDIVTDFESKKKGLEIIMAQHGAPDLVEFEPKEVEFIVILKLTISSFTGKQSSNWNKESDH